MAAHKTRLGVRDVVAEGQAMLGALNQRRSVSSGIIAAALVLVSVLLWGCGGGGSGGSEPTPAPTISVSVKAATATVSVGSTDQFSAVVSGTTNQAVTWEVNGTSGGSSAVGTISSTGLYTAPAMVPSSASVTVTAVSAEDPTESANASITVELKISVSPASESVSTFHTAQFTGTVAGVSNTGITWAVNSISGGNIAVGTIDASGLYTAPNQPPTPATVSVSATSEADPSQAATSAVTIVSNTTPPSVMSTAPAGNATGVPQSTSISIVFSEGLDPTTVNASTISLSDAAAAALPASVSYDPTSYTVTLAPDGRLTPGRIYTVTVASTVSDLAENTLGKPYTFSFTTVQPTSTPAVVAAPGTDPTTLTAVSFNGQEATPDSNGNFTASLKPEGATLVAAMVPSKSFGLMAVTITGLGGAAASQARVSRLLSSSWRRTVQSTVSAQRTTSRRPANGEVRPVHFTRWQITASERAASAPNTVTVDYQTTAESLLFLSAAFFNRDLAKAQVIMAAIAADPNTQALAAALEQASTEADPLNDPSVQKAMQTAMVSIFTTLSGISPSEQPTVSALERKKAGLRPSRPKRRAATSTTPGLAQVWTTPNCWGSTNDLVSPDSSNPLPCLDLDYIDIGPSTYTYNQNTIYLTPANCTHDSFLSCATDWLGVVAPITHLPEGGVDAIAPDMGFNDTDNPGLFGIGADTAPDSPVGPFTSCNFVGSGCTGIVLVPGHSNLQYLDISGDIDTLVSDAVSLAISQVSTANGGAPSGAIAIPNTPGQNYMVRFYSGGYGGDTDEFAEVKSSAYTDGLAYWIGGLAYNVVDSASDLLNIGFDDSSGTSDTSGAPAKTTFVKCFLDGATNGVPPLVSTVTTDVDGNAPIQSIFVDAGVQLLQTFGSFTAGCAAQTGNDDIVQSLINMVIENASNDLLDLIPILGQAKLILQVAAYAGQVAQRATELVSTASPVETGILSIAGSPAPQIGSLSSITCQTSTMTVGNQQTCSVTAMDTQGNPISPSESGVQWTYTSGDPSSITTSSGSDPDTLTVLATNPGNATLDASAVRSAGGPVVQQFFSITVDAAPVVTLTITPPSLAVPLNQVQPWQLVVIGQDKNGNTEPIGPITWTSSQPSVATIINWPGIANAGEVQLVTPGTTTVTASASGLTATAQVKVTGVSVSVSPSSATVQTGTTQQFAATVTGATNTAVTWSVNGVVGGTTAIGTISMNGLYKAPAAVPNPANVSITATSQASPSAGGSASVTVSNQLSVSVSVSPSSTTVQTGAAQQFTATVTGSTNTAVNWSVNRITGGDSAAGTITATGLYTAPAAVPNPAAVSITATSQASPSVSSSASVTVTSPPPSCSPGLTGLALNPVTVGAGQQTTGTVTLSCPPAAPVSVALTSSNATILPLPPAATVAAGVTTGTFTATASSSVTSPTQAIVTASFNNTSQVATVTINPVGVTVTVSPSTAAVQASGTQPFTATVTGTQNTTVTWSVNGITGGNSTVGTISSSGLYTAPATAPSPATATVTATSQADPSASGSATVAVASYAVLHSFDGTDGAVPQAGVVLDAAGNLYGTTYAGGANNVGTVFEVFAGGGETVLHSFAGGTDGTYPVASLVPDAQGNMYGTTPAGGANDSGIVFDVSPNGSETVLYSFTGGADGGSPHGDLVRDAAGNLYGTTSYGGTYGLGTVFEVSSGGGETVLYSFTGGSDASIPYAGVVQDAAGNLYGTTYYGGADNAGTVFEVSPSGSETVLYSFSGGADGGAPYAGLVRDAAGDLYGTTYYGGAHNAGTVFEVSPSGSETVLYSFSGGADGGAPYAGLVRDAQGNMYGTTTTGGAYDSGTVFEVSPSGGETVLYSFTGGADGGSPYAGVACDAAGNLYGATNGGGTYTDGVAFRLSGLGLQCQQPSTAKSSVDSRSARRTTPHTGAENRLR